MKTIILDVIRLRVNVEGIAMEKINCKKYIITGVVALSYLGCGEMQSSWSSSGFSAPEPDISGDGMYDAINENIINDEEKGIEIIVEELVARGCNVEKNSGIFDITVLDPSTEQYISLSPDIRFKKEPHLMYAYFEFDSESDPGKGINLSKGPIYHEIVPDTEENIRLLVNDYLDKSGYW